MAVRTGIRELCRAVCVRQPPVQTGPDQGFGPRAALRQSFETQRFPGIKCSREKK